MKNRVFAAALSIAAALFLCAVRPAAAAPALWLVQSPAGKVYLFGTVHVLRQSTPWQSPELQAAIAQSQDLYEEIANADNMKDAAAAVFKLGLDREHPLSTLIPKADVALLDKEAKQYGYGGEMMFEPMRPWLVYMMLTMLPAMHSGYTPTTGVDLQIRKEFADAGKPIHGFETFDGQAHIFADMPVKEQVTLLETQLKDMGKKTGSPEVDAIVRAWDSGDETKLESTLELDKLQGSPIYPALIGNRNQTWANILAQRLKGPGTSFVAVGAAHLLGSHGVPALLQKMGFTVTRVEIAQTSPAPAATTQPAPTPTASTTPAPSATPVPNLLTAPAGWAPSQMRFNQGGFVSDTVWISPKREGAVVAGHIDLPVSSGMDLDAFDAFFHQGLAGSPGVTNVQPSKRVKVCDGKQDATYTTVTIGKIKEDIVLALSDRAYLAEYVRQTGIKDDPSAVGSLLSLCAPK